MTNAVHNKTGLKDDLHAILSLAGLLDQDRELKLHDAIDAIPWENFLNSHQLQQLRNDTPIELGFGIVFPRLSSVFRMLGVMPIEKQVKVLELGSGSGLGTVLMSQLGGHVFCIEPIGLLAQLARKSLDQNFYQTALIKGGSSDIVWSEYAPYDLVISWRSFNQLPLKLAEQVRKGGKIVAPIVVDGNCNLFLWKVGLSISVFQLDSILTSEFINDN